MEYIGNDFGIRKVRSDEVSIRITHIHSDPFDVFIARNVIKLNLKLCLGFSQDRLEHLAFVLVYNRSDELSLASLFVFPIRMLIHSNSRWPLRALTLS